MDYYPEFRKLMGQYKVDAVFSGHTHRYIELEEGGVKYYMISGVGQRPAEGEEHTYLDVRVGGSSGVAVRKLSLARRHRGVVDAVTNEMVASIFPYLGASRWWVIFGCLAAASLVFFCLGRRK